MKRLVSWLIVLGVLINLHAKDVVPEFDGIYIKTSNNSYLETFRVPYYYWNGLY